MIEGIYHYYTIIVMRSYMNRNWPKTALFSGRSIRFGFIARWILSLAFGFAIAHAESSLAIEDEVGFVHDGQSMIGFDTIQCADLIKPNMNENRTIADVNPKLGQILARLVRAQEEFPADERGEGDHGGKPPIGMKPQETKRSEKTPPQEPGMDTVEKEAIERVLAQA